MVEMTPIPLAHGTAVGITVRLARTTLIIAATEAGYLMCGALDVRLLDERLRARGIVAARAVDVHSLDDLLDAGIDDLTAGATALGLEPGMPGREALERMLAVSQAAAP